MDPNTFIKILSKTSGYQKSPESHTFSIQPHQHSQHSSSRSESGIGAWAQPAPPAGRAHRRAPAPALQQDIRLLQANCSKSQFSEKFFIITYNMNPYILILQKMQWNEPGYLKKKKIRVYMSQAPSLVLSSLNCLGMLQQLANGSWYWLLILALVIYSAFHAL